MNTTIRKWFSRVAITGCVVGLVVIPAGTSSAQKYGPSFDVGGYQVTPFYESTPTGRTDENGVPATDRFGWAESSSAVGISISLGGSSRSVEVDPNVLADALRRAAVPEELRDPAFAHYVDLLQLGQAWDELDPATLTDIACQLAEGERVLHREHRAVKSSELFQIAVRIASDRRDDTTLERLQKYFERSGDKTRAEQLTITRKLAGEARADLPGMTLSLDETTPESYALYRGLLGEIKAAGYVRNKEALDELNGSVRELTGLTSKQREYLESIMGQTRSAIAEEEPSGVAPALDKLMVASRNDQGRQIAAGILQIIANTLNNGQGSMVSNNPPFIPIDNGGPTNNNVIDPQFPNDNNGPSDNGGDVVDDNSGVSTDLLDGTAGGVGGLNLRGRQRPGVHVQRPPTRQSTQQPTRFRNHW